MKTRLNALFKTALFLSLLGVIAVIFDLGFPHTDFSQRLFDSFYFIVVGIGIISTFLRYIETPSLFRRPVIVFDVLSVAYSLYVYHLFLFVGVPFETDLLLENPTWIRLAVILTFIREMSEVRFNYKRTYLNPAQLFVASFLAVIYAGSLMLMLPNATYSGISFIDALFTSTSAVCVTGLIVVDTATYFTQFGQIIILILIQLGGLGILTFASYFSYFFKGGSTYENQLVLSDMTNSEKVGEVFSTLKSIILITFSIELIAGSIIYLSVQTSLFENAGDRIFFAIFHAVSAFCNAGFSTLTNSIYEEGFRTNYLLQLTIVCTFVFGGLGFSIISNLISYIFYRIKKVFSLGLTQMKSRPWVLNLNSRINLITTFSLSAFAFVAFYTLEYQNTLAEHEGIGKVITALFGATTPRTAGFNSIDTASMLLPTTMLTIFLMWVGASPASTGGGIKTSTFALIVMNVLSLAKGKSKIEVFRREIAQISINRSFAIVALSFLVIGFGILLLSVFEPDMKLLDIIFECFSAYSTVGLSLGITGSLSYMSKLTIIVIMFVGRVSMLTIIIALFTKVRSKHYQYPTEEITIN